MNVLISGGAKNGKSIYAQKLAKQMADEAGVPLYYIATMIPRDDEDQARIRRHIEERAGWGFETLEQGRDLVALLSPAEAVRPEGADEADGAAAAGVKSAATDASMQEQNETACSSIDPNGAFLLDSVTALLSNEMFREDGSFDPDAAGRVAKDCTAFAKATGNTVFVSDYIYGDADRYDTMTEDYRRGLAQIDRALARVCDRVIEVSAGIIEEWKSPIGDALEE